eukprot:CAMPEP_0174270564 /NCGR_PEP_ID=MMETSP0439-20130205/44909_1 /TAXON_ID=0 /ORGANISM="Stereomyxa ramosa, Strain Chinc5" /LENGTH=274 /DNA_ID=CAMNT_0015359971 /DNA_START=35 /DNA_END=855 /DNA_ORIENTATION=-
MASSVVENRDVTSLAISLVNLVQSLKQNQSLVYIRELWRGSNGKTFNQKVRRCGDQDCPEIGKGRAVSKTDTDRLLHKMIIDNILQEEFRANGTYGQILSSVGLGKGANALLSGATTVKLTFVKKGGKRKRGFLESEFTVEEEEYTALQNLLVAELTQLTKDFAAKSESKLMYYMVFNAHQLRGIVEKLPTTLDEFAKIEGVSVSKLRDYGAAFVGYINGFIQAHPKIKHNPKKKCNWIKKQRSQPDVRANSPKTSKRLPASFSQTKRQQYKRG